MINRINLILRAKNITARQFAEEIGIQPSGMSHILGGRNNPSLDFVGKVLRRYPEIDANWLLLGRGEMYASPSPAADLFSGAPSGAGEPLLPLAEAEPEGLCDPECEEAAAPVPGACAPEAEPEAVPRVAGEPAASRRLAKMVFVYSDGTFEVLRPA